MKSIRILNAFILLGTMTFAYTNATATTNSDSKCWVERTADGSLRFRTQGSCQPVLKITPEMEKLKPGEKLDLKYKSEIEDSDRNAQPQEAMQRVQSYQPSYSSSATR